MHFYFLPIPGSNKIEVINESSSDVDPILSEFIALLFRSGTVPVVVLCYLTLQTCSESYPIHF